MRATKCHGSWHSGRRDLPSFKSAASKWSRERTWHAGLRVRRNPTTAEITAFLVDQLSPFGTEQPLSPSARRDFHRFEEALVALASERGLRRTISETSHGLAIALAADGVLRPSAGLVRADGRVKALHLPAKHLIARPNRRLDKIEGWEPRFSATAGQIVDALVEDGSRLRAHIPRLQAYVRQAKRDGRNPDGLAGIPCIPIHGVLHAPRDLAFRGRTDVWGEWKRSIPIQGVSAEVQRIYKAVGVAPGAPDPTNSMRFFQWLASQSTGVVARHIDQILRQIGHKMGPGRWAQDTPDVPFIPVESQSGEVILVSWRDATKARSKVAIPDFELLADEVRRRPGRRPVMLAIVESRNVAQPIAAYLRSIGVKTLTEVAGEPHDVCGKASAHGHGADLDHQRILDSLRSGRKGTQLRRRLAKLGLDSPESRLRTFWRERLSAIRCVAVADSVHATYELGRTQLRVSVDGKLDKASGTLWLRSGADLRASFFDVLADEVFEYSQKYYGSVLDRALRMHMNEQKLLPEHSGLADAEEPDESTAGEESVTSTPELTETAATHSAMGLNLPDLPDPRQLLANGGPTKTQTTGSGRRKSVGTRRPPSVEEAQQIEELKERHYNWHCQACIGGAEPTVLAPTRSYAARPEHRKPIIHAHHCDHVNAGGARNAGNIVLLCSYHHVSLGDAMSRAEIVSALGQAQSRRVTFGSDTGERKTLRGKVVTFRPPQRGEDVVLFFTAEHARVWLDPSDSPQL